MDSLLKVWLNICKVKVKDLKEGREYEESYDKLVLSPGASPIMPASIKGIDGPNVFSVRTVNEKGGNCCDLTHATLAMCRAAGIPARYLHGKCNYSTPLGHVIPEIFVDGKWWIADPSNNKAVWGTPTWNGMETFHGRYYELEF